MKTCEDILDWSYELPIGMLPFYVWTASQDLSYDEMLDKKVFENLYEKFLKKFDWSKDTLAFRGWCWEQFVHHYEYNK